MIRIRRAVPAASPFTEAPLSTVKAIADTVSEAEPSPPLQRDQIIREFDDPYLELVRLLRESAQIEHALMVQYLYAAFSVKSQYFEIVGGDSAGNAIGLIGIAIQEMQHLRYVSDLLRDLGAAPNLTSQDFPYDHDIYPFPLNLERLSRLSLAKYVYTEAPAAEVEPTPGTHDPFLEALKEALGRLRPNHLGSVYGAVIDLVRDVEASPPFDLPPLSGHITNLEFVKGEGESVHFNFFKSLFLATHSGFGGANVWELSPEDPSYPSIAVPTNPSALGGHPGEIADKTLRALARLGNLHYWTILLLIDLSYRYGKPAYMFLAKNHMTGPLLELGQALAAKQMGLPFDPTGLGHSPGIDEAASVRALILLLEEAKTLADALRGELPNDFSFFTIDATLEELRPLGDS